MFNWHNKKAKKSTIIGYLSRKYTSEELAKLPTNSVLELPDAFESNEYFLELNTILSDSSWKKVKYVAVSSLFISSLKNHWWQKKKVNEEESELKIPLKTEADTEDLTETSSLKSNFSEETIKPPKKETKAEENDNSSISSESSEDNSTSVYFDAENKSETNSIKSEDSEEEKGVEITLPGSFPDQPSSETNSILTYQYQFRLNTIGIIVLWKENDTQEWQEEPYQNCFFEVNKTYRNCWVTAQTIQPLPKELPKGVNCLFEVVRTKEELLEKNDWDYCLVTEFQPVEDSDTESSADELSETESEPELKGTYRYEFCVDNQGLISAWRTPSSDWKKPEVYQGKYFALDVAKYANSYCKVKTLDFLPRSLTNRYLFSPCFNEKDFYSRELNWNNCLVWEQEPLKICEICRGAFLILSSSRLCESCFQEQIPPQSFWEKNQKLLIIAGIITLVVIIYNYQE